MILAELQRLHVLKLVTVRNLVIVDYFLLTIDNSYILVYLCIDMFYILWVTTPFGSTEHEIPYFPVDTARVIYISKVQN
jgi:hypothetical protein